MIIQIEKWRYLEGKAFGLSLPSLLTSIKLEQVDKVDLQSFNQLISELLAVALPPASSAKTPYLQLAENILFWHTQIQQATGLPVFETGRALNSSWLNKDTLHLQLILPAYQSKASQEVLKWLARVINASLSSDPNPQQANKSFKALQTSLKKFVPAGSNTSHFLKAAHELNIPWSNLCENIFEYGQGEYARRLDSSFTDQTSTISARIARNKALTSTLLKKAGLPVAGNFSISSASAAKRVARKLGFPVVIKPADKDGGVGVTAGIYNDAEIDKAFSKARKSSRRLLIEKHIEGQDYRLTVLNGTLIWAVLRQPGGVTGNGRDSIAVLLKRLNADPRRFRDVNSPLKVIKLDKEAHHLLSKAGLTTDSVPNAGQFIQLRSTANITNGGIPLAVIDKVHPDNRQLAENAAKALKLDFAGIDLIIPDISQSWLKTKASICEVNAQPQLGNVTKPHIYSEVLTELVQSNGRIPAILIIAEHPSHELASKLAQRLQTNYEQVAIATKRGLMINGTLINQTDSVFKASQSALSHQNVNAIIMPYTVKEVLQTGFATDQFDLVIMMPHKTVSPSLLQVCHMVFPHPIGRLFVQEQSKQVKQLARQLGVTKISQYTETDSLDGIVDSAIDLLL